MSSQPKQPNAREVGILFRGDMVRATIAAAEGDPNGKTETRRAIKPPPGEGWAPSHQHVATRADLARPSFEWVRPQSPCGEQEFFRVPARWSPGDILWARETWRSVGWRPENGHLIEYQADGRQVWREAPTDTSSSEVYDYEHPDRWRPSIFLFRWACRVTMPVLTVRAERLHDITEQGAAAEGFPAGWYDGNDLTKAAEHNGGGSRWWLGSRMRYELAWAQINGVDSWAANPPVWVIGWDPKLVVVSP